MDLSTKQQIGYLRPQNRDPCRATSWRVKRPEYHETTFRRRNNVTNPKNIASLIR
jgi:hypothetical protein